MTPEEAAQLDEDLDAFAALRRNRAWTNHVLPRIEAMRDEHRGGMNNHALPAVERCEHVTAWENAQQLLEFLDKTEPRLRQRIREHFEKVGGVRARPFSKGPLATAK